MSQNNGSYDNWMLTKAVSLQDAFAALVWKDYVHYLAVGISSPLFELRLSANFMLRTVQRAH